MKWTDFKREILFFLMENTQIEPEKTITKKELLNLVQEELNIKYPGMNRDIGNILRLIYGSDLEITENTYNLIILKGVVFYGGKKY